MASWRWLRKFLCYSRQGRILVCVATFLWVVTTFNIHSTTVVSRGSEQTKYDVNNLSEHYITSSARGNGGGVNGRLAANDLIKRESEQCTLTNKEKQQYPKCQEEIEHEYHSVIAHIRLNHQSDSASRHVEILLSFSKLLRKKWMKQHWKLDPCYASYGVDGSVCSFIMYLSETEDVCPRSVLNGSNLVPKQDKVWMQSANRTKDLDGLMLLLKDPNERHAYAWIRMRIERMWPRWQEAIKNFSQKQDLSKRRPKKILLHLGLLSKTSGFDIAESQFKGGPLGELVQWSDLITALYVLGHTLTITSETVQLSSIVSQLWATNTHCKSTRGLPVDLIYIDIIGLKQFKSYVGNRYSAFSCLLRIVDSFGTEPAFNLRYFASQRKKLTAWSGLNLMPQQFFNLFPHTPDNSFMGFVVERHLNESNLKDIEKTNMAVVYGKNDYMWKFSIGICKNLYFDDRKQFLNVDKEDFLNTVNKSGIVLHGTVYKDSKPGKLKNVPNYVINHGVLNGGDLHTLLSKSKIFLGLGFPYEGPAPLEAIANGAVFINPKFEKPHNSHNTLFFKGKPTERDVTSQHPYAEQFIGEPYVYTINIKDVEEVRTTIQKVLDTNHFKGYLPYEYTEEGFIQRMNAYIEHQNFCKSQKQFTKWPPESAVQILFGEAGISCKDVCWEKNLICEPSHFLETNAHNALISHGASCAANKTLTDIFYPALDNKTKECIIQQEELLFSCVGKQGNLRRLCPCRNYTKGQTALCIGCET